jgi:hypothetical protein
MWNAREAQKLNAATVEPDSDQPTARGNLVLAGSDYSLKVADSTAFQILPQLVLLAARPKGLAFGLHAEEVPIANTGASNSPATSIQNSQPATSTPWVKGWRRVISHDQSQILSWRSIRMVRKSSHQGTRAFALTGFTILLPLAWQRRSPSPIFRTPQAKAFCVWHYALATR